MTTRAMMLKTGRLRLAAPQMIVVLVTIALLAVPATFAPAIAAAQGVQSATATTATTTLALTGGTLIDGTGKPAIRDAVVVIDGTKIVAAGRRADVSVPPGARVIDATGQFIIPGLMDANVHLMLGTSIEYIVRHEGRYEELIEEAAQVTLKNGVTTVFDSWGPLQPLLNVRDSIRRGETIGSRMFVAGNIVGFSGPFGRDFNRAAETTASKALVKRINGVWEENVGQELLYMSPDQLRTEIRKYVGRGIDFLKYGVSTHNNLYLQFTPEAQRAIVEETHKAGIPVQTHTTNVMSLKQAIEVGNDLLQHCDVTGPVAIPDMTLDLLRERNVYCAILPRTRARLRFELTQGAADDRGPQLLDVMHFNAIRLLQAGAPLLLSTDAGIMDPDAAEVQKPEQRAERSTALGEAHFLWFKAMQENGMRPMDAILAATRNIALAYKRPDIGTIEKGKLADLVVLDADPLDDLNNIRKIAMVIKDGAVVDRAKLPMKKVLTTLRSTRVIITTDLGPIEVELEPTRAPKTVENFLKYVDGGFYDGGSFYRTVRADNQPKDEQKIEVLQGGINPARRADQPPPIAIERTKDTGIYHTEGAISMARGAPDSARGEFFICLDDRPSLDFGGQRNKDGQGFAAFGHVVSGLDLVKKIQAMKADEQRLSSPVKILKVTRVKLGDS